MVEWHSLDILYINLFCLYINENFWNYLCAYVVLPSVVKGALEARSTRRKTLLTPKEKCLFSIAQCCERFSKSKHHQKKNMSYPKSKVHGNKHKKQKKKALFCEVLSANKLAFWFSIIKSLQWKITIGSETNWNL